MEKDQVTSISKLRGQELTAFMDEWAKGREALASDSTRLAQFRTGLAQERTGLAHRRTGLAEGRTNLSQQAYFSGGRPHRVS